MCKINLWNIKRVLNWNTELLNLVWVRIKIVSLLAQLTCSDQAKMPDIPQTILIHIFLNENCTTFVIKFHRELFMNVQKNIS